eukprot:scaffold1226_cov250-Pinguiococcus_pyrenoidosus.AAC.3
MLTWLVFPLLKPLVLGQDKHLAADLAGMLLRPGLVFHGRKGDHERNVTLGGGIRRNIPAVGIGHPQLLRLAAQAQVEHHEAIAVLHARHLPGYHLVRHLLHRQQLLHGRVVPRGADDLACEDFVTVRKSHADATSVPQQKLFHLGAHEDATTVSLHHRHQALGQHFRAAARVARSFHRQAPKDAGRHHEGRLVWSAAGVDPDTAKQRLKCLAHAQFTEHLPCGSIHVAKRLSGEEPPHQWSHPGGEDPKERQLLHGHHHVITDAHVLVQLVLLVREHRIKLRQVSFLFFLPK